MKNIVAAFPKRPLNLQGDNALQLMWRLVLCIGMILAGIGLSYFIINLSLPNIMRDWEISKGYEVIQDAKIEKGTCKVSRAIFRDCELDIWYRDKNYNHIKYHHELSFLDIGSAKYEVEVIRSTSNPKLVSINLAIEKIWNRILTLVFLIGIGVLISVGGLIVFFRHLRFRKLRKDLNGKIFRPVLVNISQITNLNGTIIAIYTCDEAGKDKKSNYTFKKNEEGPFYINNIEGDTKALGATVDGHSKIILLDETLQCFDMTDSERQALWHAREQDMARS